MTTIFLNIYRYKSQIHSGWKGKNYTQGTVEQADSVNLFPLLKCSFYGFTYMSGWFAILHPFQQYLSHIRTMVNDNEGSVQWNPVYS